MVNQKRIALFVDIDNMPLNKKHVDNIITQLEKSGEIVYAKIYGVTDRRHREIICDAVARGFETVPPVYPTRRGSTKVFDIRILVDLCELFATNKSIDGVAIVANPAHQVYLFSRLKRNGIKIFACDNLDEYSAKFVDEILSFGYNDPNSVSKAKKEKSGADLLTETPAQEQAELDSVEQPEQVVEEQAEPVKEVVEEQEQSVEPEQEQPAPQVEEQPVADSVEAEQIVEEVAIAQEPVVEEQPEQQAEVYSVVLDEETADEQPEVVEQPQDEEVEEQPEVVEEPQPEVLAEQPEQEEIVVEEIEPIEEEQNDNLDILRQIQQIKQDVPNNDDEEDEALIEKIKQLLDEFN
ncbi:MAG: NYN domain-containing protein [Clostridia bacterium]|nr:NYN domain-containing protein [Clostridia bacterium]